jgi:hypothetical protein
MKRNIKKATHSDADKMRMKTCIPTYSRVVALAAGGIAAWQVRWVENIFINFP